MSFFMKNRNGDDMRILVTGAAGMLGSSLVPVLKGAEHTVLATDINLTGGITVRLDVRRLGDMLQAAVEFKPHMLMHLAAETDLEICESRADYAYEENFVGTQNACVVCKELGIPLAYISTAGVFDGKKQDPYTEFDAPNPINVYGASKYAGETIIRETIPDHFIVRAGWMVGGGELDKKFVRKIIDQLQGGSKMLHAVTDRYGTPTYAPAFSAVLEKLVRMKLHGTYHLACRGRATRYDVAAEMLRIMGREDVELKPVTSEFFKEQYFAPRPASEEMLNYVLELRKMNDMPHWKDALSEYLRKYFPAQLR
jgi:dTDP-4-dehydrorhamnose reductase